MSDNILNATDRMLRDIQRDLADMRDERIVFQAMLDRLDANVTGISAEQRALRSQFDRFRNETRQASNETREALARIEQLLTKEV